MYKSRLLFLLHHHHQNLVIYDWFERENGNQYKLDLTKEQYDQMKSIVSPIG